MSAEQQQSLRVFVVDDDRVIATTLATILRDEGYKTKAFWNPQEVIREAEHGAPDILISDVIMPGMNGIELASYFREHFGTCRVMLISGQRETATLVAEAAKQGQQFDVVAKPILPRNLIIELSKLTGVPCL